MRFLSLLACLVLVTGCKDPGDNDDDHVGDNDSGDDDSDELVGIDIEELQYGGGLIHFTGWLDEYDPEAAADAEGVLYALDAEGSWRRVWLPEQESYGSSWSIAQVGIAPDGTSYLIVTQYTPGECNPCHGVVRYDGAGSVDPLVMSDLSHQYFMDAAWGDDGKGVVVTEDYYNAADAAHLWKLDGTEFIAGWHQIMRPLVSLWFDGQAGWIIGTNSIGDWSSYGTGVWRYTEGAFEEMTLPGDLRTSIASSGCGAGADRAWIISKAEEEQTYTRWVFENDAWSVDETGLPSQESISRPTCLEDGTAWATSLSGGEVRYYDGDEWTSVADLDVLAGTVVDLAVTGNGDIWLLTQSFGNGGALQLYSEGVLVDSMPDMPVVSEDYAQFSSVGMAVR